MVEMISGLHLVYLLFWYGSYFLMSVLSFYYLKSLYKVLLWFFFNVLNIQILFLDSSTKLLMEFPVLNTLTD